MASKKIKLDVLLQELHNQFIALKNDDLKKSQDVFLNVFNQLKQYMEKQCNFFNKFSTQVMYGGSVADGIKVGKLDEFDMDIVIKLPISYADDDNGIIIENDRPGFVRLKIGNAFDHLDKQKDWEDCNKVTRDWRDSKKYFLQSKFRHWLHSIVQRAVNDLNNSITVNDRTYQLTYKASGPAYTLQIRNSVGDPEFTLDIDLVPVIRFMLPRWPAGYRAIESQKCKEWLVVPKPNKTEQDTNLQNRCWRLSFQEFERELIKDRNNLKPTIRLIKKLRDSLQMTAIASYFIKTLFLWKIHNFNRRDYWEKSLSSLFYEMVQDLHTAVKEKKILYFWNESYNLIDDVRPTVLAVYATKLETVIKNIEDNDMENVIYALLSTEEKNEFKCSKFYKNQIAKVLVQTEAKRSVDILEEEFNLIKNDKPTQQQNIDKDEVDRGELGQAVQNLVAQVKKLTEKIGMLENRIIKLEAEKILQIQNPEIFLNNVNPSFSISSSIPSTQLH